MNTAYIALGANLDEPLTQLQKALISLENVGDITARSSFYQSASILSGQPDYINAVAQLHTALAPHDLLRALQQIENQQGRIRQEHWGARIIDLDIILFNNDTINSPTLTIPHAHMLERHFVLLPLLEINAQLQLPDGQEIATFVSQLNLDAIEKMP